MCRDVQFCHTHERRYVRLIEPGAPRNVRLYVAAPFAWSYLVQRLCAALAVYPIDIVSRWHLPEYLGDPAPIHVPRNYVDLDRADALVLFHSPEGTPGGGRLVEAGYMLGRGKPVIYYYPPHTTPEPTPVTMLMTPKVRVAARPESIARHLIA